MDYIAHAKFIKYSPFKLRPLADVIRGKDVEFALSWLATSRMKKTIPIQKVVKSAIANAKNRSEVESSDLVIKSIVVDQGPTFKYYKPGAMGRGNVYKKRLSHISVVLQEKDKR